MQSPVSTIQHEGAGVGVSHVIFEDDDLQKFKYRWHVRDDHEMLGRALSRI